MPFNKNQTYTILNQTDNSRIEVKAISNLENWYRGKIASISLDTTLESLFSEVEKYFKEGDFAALKKSEDQIISCKLFVEENEIALSEIQISGGKSIFFKIT